MTPLTSNAGRAAPVDHRCPEDFVLEAELFSARGELSEAVGLYHRALAGIPDYLGVQPWFRRYLVEDAPVAPRSGRFVGGIYAALSKCLCDLLRFEDALYAAEAALTLDPGSSAVDEWYRRTGDDAPRQRARSAPPLDTAAPPDPSGVRAPVERLLTLVITSHCTEKLRRNARLAPPGIGLVEKAYASCLKNLGPRIPGCRKILCFDQQDATNSREREFKNNLRQFAANHCFEFRPFRAAGLQRVVASVLPEIRSPYILMLEQDWEFLPPPVEIETLLNIFENHPRVHHVRFNKQRNRVANFDFILERETQIGGIPLTRTAAYSNNPHIVRRAKLEHEWLPLCLGDSFCRAVDLRGKSFGVEEPLFKHHMRDIRNLGFSAAHDRWGAYILGRWADPERVRHLGE